jgi:hypothetical protein
MEINTGHFNIFNILKFVAENPTMPKRNVGEWKNYAEIISDIVSNVPEDKPGWYLWGRFNEVGWWETIYLGKSGNKKTASLKARLREELSDERVAFWATIYGREVATKIAHKLYKGKYTSNIQRSLRKSNTHFVIWLACSDLSEEEIVKEEGILIDVYRPANNAQRQEYPKQSSFTQKIIRAFDAEMDKIKAC